MPDPTGVAVTSTGLILVASFNGRLVHVFQGTNTTESRTINVVNRPGGIAVDPVGNDLYVTYPDTGQVRIFGIDSGIILPGGLNGLGNPFDIAFQPQTGTFYVTDYAAGVGTIVHAFARGAIAVDADRSLNGLLGPWGVAVSPVNGAVHVSDRAPSEVHLFPAVTSSVSGAVPAVGPVTGGTDVNVTGTNLGAVTQVTFNGVVAEQTGPALPTTIPVKVPAATLAGPVTIQVKWAGNIAGKADAFTYTPVAPGKATEVLGARGNQQVTVSWKAPAFTGGVPIASYLVTPSPSGAPCATTSTSCTIAGLTNGTPYSVHGDHDEHRHP